MSYQSLFAIVPLLCVVAAAVAAMLAEAFRARHESMPIAGLGVVGLVAAGASAILLWGRNAASFGVVTADTFGLFITLILVAVGILTLCYSPPVVRQHDLPAGEYYALVLFAIAGMMLMATASELVIMFLALEVFSLAVYVLTGIQVGSPASTEGAFKYFVLGSFSSAVFVYAIAFAYGLTGTTSLAGIGQALSSPELRHSPLALAALGLFITGFGFKVSAVPFHMWTPDAYEGAPTLVTGFMSTAVKAAAFAALARVVLVAFGPLVASWVPVLWVLAAVTMAVGTVAAVRQTNMKRMLAYSSIAHAGFMLVGLTSATDTGAGAVLFYLLVYAVANLGAFATIALLGRSGDPNEQIADYNGLWRRHPAVAAALTVFLLSLGGMPPTAGFIGKWYVFSAAVQAGNYGLAILGVLASVVAVYFYLRIVVAMFMSEEEPAIETPPVARGAAAALAVSVLVTFYLGIVPTRLIELASRSVSHLF